MKTYVAGFIRAVSTMPNELDDVAYTVTIALSTDHGLKVEFIQCEVIKESRVTIERVAELLATRKEYIFEFDLYTDKTKHLIDVYTKERA